MGYSLSFSNIVTVLTDGYPISMNTPVAGDVTPVSMALSWTALSDMVQNSGDLPVYYRLEWYNKETDPYNPSWDEVTKEASGLKFAYTYVRSSGVFPSGSTQKFRVIAKNHIGLGTPSAEVSILADEVPIKMSTVTVTTVVPNAITLVYTDVTLATETGRDDVTFFHVMWQDPSLNWVFVSKYPTTTTKVLTFTHTLASGVFLSNSN